MRESREIRAFAVDMDGTLIVGGQPCPGAADLLNAIRQRNAAFVLLTNNSSRRRGTFGDKLRAAGLDVSDDDILTSADAAITWLKRAGHQRLFVLGTEDLREELTLAGFALADVGEPADVVVVAYDRSLTYPRLEHACLLLADPQVAYLATHPDFTCITPAGLVPDAGAIIAAIETVVHRLPVVVGKPEQPMIDAALGRLGTTAAETMVVGDQLDTDVTMGLQGGFFTVLTLTGETSPERLAESDLRPDAVVAHVGELAEMLTA